MQVASCCFSKQKNQWRSTFEYFWCASVKSGGRKDPRYRVKVCYSHRQTSVTIALDFLALWKPFAGDALISAFSISALKFTWNHCRLVPKRLRVDFWQAVRKARQHSMSSGRSAGQVSYSIVMYRVHVCCIAQEINVQHGATTLLECLGCLKFEVFQ